MDNLLVELNKILVDPPGNLIYHLILGFSVFASLQTALVTRKNVHNGRSLLGLNLILLAQLVLFTINGLSWQGVISSHTFLPILDRAVIVFSLVWIGWMWAFPTPSASKSTNTVVSVFLSVLNLGILILFLFGASRWSSQAASLPFNTSWLDWAWCIAGVVIVLLSLIVVAIRRPDGWTIGVGMALLNVAGLLAHIFAIPAEGDYSSLIRVFQLAAYPLLPGLMARQNLMSEAALAPDFEPQGTPSAAARAPRITDPRAVHAWVNLALQEDPASVCTGVARAVAQSLQADLCYVVITPGDSGAPIIIEGGYDLVREDAVPGTFLEQSRFPILATALQKARPARILPDEHKGEELKNLSEALNFQDAGSLLLMPLTQNNRPWGGLLFISPYSKRQWTGDEMNYLTAEADSITRVLTQAQTNARKAESKPDSRTESRRPDELDAIARQAEELRQQNVQLNNELNALRKNAAAPGHDQTDVDALITIQQETQNLLHVLQAENAHLKASLNRSGTVDNAQLEIEMRAVLEEMAHLQNELGESNRRILELEREGPGKGVKDQDAALAILQDMRHPLSTILGYTDLLLAESQGILGKSQRNFVEHIRNASERLRSLVDNGIYLTSSGHPSGNDELPPVEIGEIVDQAVDQISPLLFEHSIQLHVDLPDKLPAIHANRDALQNIADHLLHNAVTAVSNEGTIALRARLWQEDEDEYIILQVTDSGGGIAQEDLPRVFTRHYGTTQTPVAGTGEDGAGLAVAKALTLALGGRIWVESVPGRTSTFTVLIPTYPSQTGSSGPNLMTAPAGQPDPTLLPDPTAQAAKGEPAPAPPPAQDALS